MLITRNGQFLCPSPSHGSGLVKGKEIRSIGPLGSELWPFKEGNHQIGPKIGTFLTLFVNPTSHGYNPGPEFKSPAPSTRWALTLEKESRSI